ncbi:MAG: glycosyltransferase family 87 protein [Anaerolineae bacterium]|nr:glycosyltransferase family 87 protein [Anaerolineae bacterium]
MKRYALALTVLAFLVVEAGWAAVVVMANKGTDFYLYYLAAEALKRGQDIYSLDATEWQRLAIEVNVPHYVTPYLYPPLLATLIQPLTLLPPRFAFAIWSGINVLVVLITALWLSRWLADRWVVPWIFIGLAGYVPVLTTVYAGQVNLFVLLSVVAYLYALARGRPAGAGLALAMGVLLKPISVTLALHAAWKFLARTVLWLFVGLVLLGFIAIPLIGLKPYQTYLRLSLSLANLMQAGEPVVYPPNQGLSGFFGRLLTHHEFGSALTHNPALAKTLTLSVSAVLALATAALCWPGKFSKDLFLLEAGLVVVTTHLIAPVSWFHHMALAFVALSVAWQSASGWERVCILIAYFLMNLQGLFWHPLVGHTLLLSLGTYGLLVLWGVLAWQMVKHRRRPW